MGSSSTQSIRLPLRRKRLVDIHCHENKFRHDALLIFYTSIDLIFKFILDVSSTFEIIFESFWLDKKCNQEQSVPLLSVISLQSLEYLDCSQVQVKALTLETDQDLISIFLTLMVE